ncbi:hypothetical protein GJV14_03540 [Enterobacteriaceae bacterium RIT697]|uniref:hypothetical protein n=1 Tax=Pantoea sp. YR343 TaxID=1144341 RepID=UPI0012AE0361|nr:hypothetical protein [Pantoea sp. YR343]MRT23017.1 hypothetical protein [Enterobacteriaceae bacterium RIT697]
MSGSPVVGYCVYLEALFLPIASERALVTASCALARALALLFLLRDHHRAASTLSGAIPKVTSSMSIAVTVGDAINICNQNRLPPLNYVPTLDSNAAMRAIRDANVTPPTVTVAGMDERV